MTGRGRYARSRAGRAPANLTPHTAVVEAHTIAAGWLTLRPEATLRKRLIHRGIRVEAWVGSMLSAELTTMPH